MHCRASQLFDVVLLRSSDAVMDRQTDSQISDIHDIHE
jgi:hypothetical protein